VVQLLEPYLAPLKPVDTSSAPAAPEPEGKEGGEGGEKAAGDGDAASREGDAASREVFRRVRAEAESAAKRERQARLQVWAAPLSCTM
jgi:hypothetical protein